MNKTLKPCPFCGTEAVLTEHEPHDHSPGLVALTGIPAKHPGSWTIECVACSCGMIHATRDEVVAAWNRRISASIADTATEPTDLLPNALWMRRGSGTDEWWSFKGYQARKDAADQWVLRKGGEELYRHTYLQVVMAHAERQILASAESIADTAGAKPDLHGQIMNNRCYVPDGYGINMRVAYQQGHRDARHASADLVNAATPASSVADAAGAKPDEREQFQAWLDKQWENNDSITAYDAWMERAALAAPPAPSVADAAGASDLEALLADITAIDTWHRGSPSYEHDAGWFKDRVVRLLEERIAKESGND